MNLDDCLNRIKDAQNEIISRKNKYAADPNYDESDEEEDFDSVLNKVENNYPEKIKQLFNSIMNSNSTFSENILDEFKQLILKEQEILVEVVRFNMMILESILEEENVNYYDSFSFWITILEKNKYE
jgi:hypothetical protein